ncbi:hypothetical protein T09_7780 [Trichinella sp. T9]|nr:hypothetical protein T09_7780 [Trichinella sp. T9]
MKLHSRGGLKVGLRIVSSVIKRYSYHMVKTNRLVKKASTTVLTRLIEISKQYCIVTMFNMSCIICMDMITKTGYITNLREISFTSTGEAEQRFQFQRNCFAMGEEWQISKKCIHYSSYFVDFISSLQMNRNSLGQNVKVVWIRLLCFRYDLQLIFSIAWGVACGYLFENLENFWNLRKFCRRRSPKHSLRANIF